MPSEEDLGPCVEFRAFMDLSPIIAVHKATEKPPWYIRIFPKLKKDWEAKQQKDIDQLTGK